MHLTKALVGGLTVTSIGFAAISGKVVDATGAAIQGAQVRLENEGSAAVTQADGSFFINSTASNFTGPIGGKASTSLAATMQNGILVVHIPVKAEVKVTMFGFNGRQDFSRRYEMDAGRHSMALPNPGPGLKWLRIESGNQMAMLKSFSMGGYHRFLPSTKTHEATRKNPVGKTGASVVVNDVLAVTKTGFLNYRMVVAGSDTTGIAIKMIDCAGTVTDADGNVYQTVKIGNQEWMAENLRSTKYTDGTEMASVTLGAAWGMPSAPAFCFYGNTTNQDSIKRFGALYNWTAANSARLAPPGWHLPTDAEWAVLEKHLSVTGSAKSIASMTDWRTDTTIDAVGNNLSINNKNGFSSLPSGYRIPNGQFLGIGSSSRYWSASDISADAAGYRALGFDGEAIRMPVSYRSLVMKTCGHSVRFLKND